MALHGTLSAPLAAEAFGENIEVQTYGNVLSASGFLYGLATSDLRASDLEVVDPAFSVIIGLRATKRSEPPTRL